MQKKVSGVKIDPEAILQTMRLAEQNFNQRTISEELGFSLGKTNYIMRALIEKSLIKAERFINSDSKMQYRYALTPKGVKERIALAEKFIALKKQEYEKLEVELQKLKQRTPSKQKKK
jgi:EPS-associated MarR family transcriptional regulator